MSIPSRKPIFRGPVAAVCAVLVVFGLSGPGLARTIMETFDKTVGLFDREEYGAKVSRRMFLAGGGSLEIPRYTGSEKWLKRYYRVVRSKGLEHGICKVKPSTVLSFAYYTTKSAPFRIWLDVGDKRSAQIVVDDTIEKMWIWISFPVAKLPLGAKRRGFGVAPGKTLRSVSIGSGLNAHKVDYSHEFYIDNFIVSDGVPPMVRAGMKAMRKVLSKYTFAPEKHWMYCNRNVVLAFKERLTRPVEPKTILLVGDSVLADERFMKSLKRMPGGPSSRGGYKYVGERFVSKGFDLSKSRGAVEVFLEEKRPEVAVFCFGFDLGLTFEKLRARDAKAIKAGEREAGERSSDQVVARRNRDALEKIVKKCLEMGTLPIFITPPVVMRRVEGAGMVPDGDIRTFAAMFERTAKSEKLPYVDTFAAFNARANAMKFRKRPAVMTSGLSNGAYSLMASLFTELYGALEDTILKKKR